MKELRKRLIRMYSWMSAGILTILFGFLILYQNIQTRNEIKADFLSCVYELKSKLQADSMLSDIWLSKLEADHHIVVSISDNGNPLFFHGAYVPDTNRDLLFEKLENCLTREGFSPYLRPISSSEKESSVFSFSGEHHDRYYGLCFVLHKGSSYLTVHILKQIELFSFVHIKRTLLYVFLDLLGVVLMMFICRSLVDRALLPVKQNQQRQTEFIAAASHELRSPLAVIRANNSSENPQKETIIEKECQRMSRLINDLLLLASGDAQTWKLNLSTINIETLLLTIYENAQPSCKEKQMTVSLCLPDEILPELTGDYDRILQVLTILISNAFCYAPAHSSIELGCLYEHKQIKLWVSDHGPGIPKEDSERVFDRFYRVDQSRKDKSHFGLGLSIAKELVTLHHGTIEVSETNGGGATFTIRLPLIKSY